VDPLVEGARARLLRFPHVDVAQAAVWKADAHVHQRAGQRLRADLVEDPLVELGLDRHVLGEGIETTIFDRVAERLVEYARNELRYGYPDDDATNFGPVVSVDLDGAVR
jgi:hypothetical protein